MEKIHYIAYFGNISNDRNLYIVPSGISKMSYVISSLKKSNCNVQIFSTAITRNNFMCHYKGYEEVIDEQERVKYIDTFGSKLKLIKFFSILWMYIQLIIYLLFKVKKDEKVIVYHSTSYKLAILFTRMIKRYKLIFEVEELYSAADNENKYRQQKEIRYLSKADAFIVVNDLMAQKCGFDNKPHLVLYGNYEIPKINEYKFSEDNINVVYAGVIGKKNSDAFLAVESAAYVSNKYKIHILGYGPQENIDELEKLINQTNLRAKRNAVVYHGCLTGQEYSDFLSSMQIGLSTRVLTNDLSNFTFPSKLLVYLSHGLRPVCSPIDCVKYSRIAEGVTFYEENKPEYVADAIHSIKPNELVKQNEILLNLEKVFLSNLNDFLKNID